MTQRAYAGNSEKPMGDRVRYSLLHKLTTRKLPNATMKKKKKLHKCAKLAQNMLFFASNDGHKSLFTNYAIHTEKIRRKKLHKKLLSQTDYKNHICIL